MCILQSAWLHGISEPDLGSWCLEGFLTVCQHAGLWTVDHAAPFIIACPSNEVSHLPSWSESWHGNVNAWYLRNLQAQDLRILGFYDKILQLFAGAVSGWRAPQLSFKINSSVPNSQGQLLLWWMMYLVKVDKFLNIRIVSGEFILILQMFTLQIVDKSTSYTFKIVN